MEVNDFLKEVAKRKEKEEQYKKEQFTESLENPNFEQLSVNQLINEILIQLTGNDIRGDRYINSIPSEAIHQYIYDLGILYKIKQKL